MSELILVSSQLTQEDTQAAGGRASGVFPILEAAVPYFVVLPMSRSVLDEWALSDRRNEIVHLPWAVEI